ncbi:unnamed protein product [Parajaminaea phylloscopi]
MGAFHNFVDGFRADPNAGEISMSHAHHAPSSNDDSDSKKGDIEKASVSVQGYAPDTQPRHTEGHVVVDERGLKLTTADSGLQRNLKSRHMQMIAIGGAIGTGLFIGSGSALANGGPASLMIDYIIIGGLLACTVLALGELATCFPVAGSFASYSQRFISPAWSVAMGYNYWMQWFLAVPLELVAASIVIQYWDPDRTITPGVWITIFAILIGVINFFGVRGYGEFEFCASMVKVTAVVIFIIIAIVINCGGAPNGEYLGAKTWGEGRAFTNGFKGFCSVFVTASFAFAGTEMVGLAAAESANPRREVPKAAKQVFYRVFLFYVVSLLLISLIVASDDPRLLGGASSYDARASPFVIAINIGQIKVLPHIINAVILVSVLSVGNSGVFAASRTLCALAQQGMAPKIFTFIDKRGRPTPAVLLSMVISGLAYLVYSSSQNDVFNWLMGLSGLSSIFTWASICLAHIRFRKAWRFQGKTLEELPWKSPLGVAGSWVGFVLNLVVLCATFYKSAFPIHEGSMTSQERAKYFFQSYIAAPIVLLFFVIGWFCIPSPGWVPLSAIDIQTGRKDGPSLETLRAERAEMARMPMWRKVKHFLL